MSPELSERLLVSWDRFAVAALFEQLLTLRICTQVELPVMLGPESLMLLCTGLAVWTRVQRRRRHSLQGQWAAQSAASYSPGPWDDLVWSLDIEWIAVNRWRMRSFSAPGTKVLKHMTKMSSNLIIQPVVMQWNLHIPAALTNQTDDESWNSQSPFNPHCLHDRSVPRSTPSFPCLFFALCLNFS